MSMGCLLMSEGRRHPLHPLFHRYWTLVTILDPVEEGGSPPKRSDLYSFGGDYSCCCIFSVADRIDLVGEMTRRREDFRVARTIGFEGECCEVRHGGFWDEYAMPCFLYAVWRVRDP